MYNKDFFTFLPNDTKPTLTKEKEKLYIGFDNKNESTEFLRYLRSKYVRFGLSIYKVNQNLKNKELTSVPFLKSYKNYSDEFLIKELKLTKDEIKFIEKEMPIY